MPTTHPGIMVSPGMDERPDQLQREIRALLAAAETGALDVCWEHLLALVPSFQGATNAQAAHPPSQVAETTA